MDRRSLITRGLATVVAVGVAPAAFAMPSSEFDRALAAWRKERAIFANGHIPDDVAQEAVKRIDAAFIRLLHVPSRHVGDVSTKLDALIVEYDDCQFPAELVELIAADARRLAG